MLQQLFQRKDMKVSFIVVLILLIPLISSTGCTTVAFQKYSSVQHSERVSTTKVDKTWSAAGGYFWVKPISAKSCIEPGLCLAAGLANRASTPLLYGPILPLLPLPALARLIIPNNSKKEPIAAYITLQTNRSFKWDLCSVSLRTDTNTMNPQHISVISRDGFADPVFQPGPMRNFIAEPRREVISCSYQFTEGVWSIKLLFDEIWNSSTPMRLQLNGILDAHNTTVPVEFIIEPGSALYWNRFL